MKLKLLSASCLALVFSSSAFAGMDRKLDSSSGHNDVVFPSEGSAPLPSLHGSSDAGVLGSGSGYGVHRGPGDAHTSSMLASEDGNAPLSSLHGSNDGAMLDAESSPAGAHRGLGDGHTQSMMAGSMNDYAPLPPLDDSSDAAKLDAESSPAGAHRGLGDGHTQSMMAGSMNDYAPLPSLDGSNDGAMLGAESSPAGAGRGLTDAHTGSMMAEDLVKPDAPKRSLPPTPAQDELMASDASGELDKLEAELIGKTKITKEELAVYKAKLINNLKPLVLGYKKPELAQKWLAAAERVNALAQSSQLGEQKGIVGTPANHIRKLAGNK